MSYILDSLKKSEKERAISQSSGAEVFRQAPYLEQNDSHHHSTFLLLMGFFFILSAIAAVYWYSSIAKNEELVNPISSDVNLPVVESQVQTPLETLQSKLEKPQVSQPVLSETVNEPRQLISRKPSADVVNERQQAIALYEKSLAEAREKEIEALYAKTETLTSADRIVTELESPNEAEPVVKIEPENIAPTVEPETEPTIPSIYELNSVSRRNIPVINYGAHIYATDNQSGFVILNGARARMGDSLGNGLFVERIEENQVVLSFDGLVFSLPAMKSWTGE